MCSVRRGARDLVSANRFKYVQNEGLARNTRGNLDERNQRAPQWPDLCKGIRRSELSRGEHGRGGVQRRRVTRSSSPSRMLFFRKATRLAAPLLMKARWWARCWISRIPGRFARRLRWWKLSGSRRWWCRWESFGRHRDREGAEQDPHEAGAFLCAGLIGDFREN